MSAVTENAIIQKLLHIFKFWPAVDKGELLPLVARNVEVLFVFFSCIRYQPAALGK